MKRQQRTLAVAKQGDQPRGRSQVPPQATPKRRYFSRVFRDDLDAGGSARQAGEGRSSTAPASIWTRIGKMRCRSNTPSARTYLLAGPARGTRAIVTPEPPCEAEQPAVYIPCEPKARGKKKQRRARQANEMKDDRAPLNFARLLMDMDSERMPRTRRRPWPPTSPRPPRTRRAASKAPPWKRT